MHLIKLDQVDSTNEYCKRNLDRLQPEDVIYTLCQVKGKGTKGKAWQAEPGESLAFSIVLKNFTLENLTALPLLWGLVVSEALSELTKAQIRIKWPNDVLFNRRKVCGILCESIIGKSIDIVCGIGINISQSHERLADQNLFHAASLYSETGSIYEPEQILACIFRHWEKWYPGYLKSGFPSIKREYSDKCYTLNKQIRVLQDGSEIQGTAVGIDNNGNLLCEIDGKCVSIHHGEASIRGLWDYV